MTPTGRQLQQRLEDRRGWFHSWLFQWHGLRDSRNPVQVDLFNGKTSYMGGIEFSGSARDVYWDAITRGVRKEILEQFAWVDEQVRRYNSATATRAIDECAGLLISFASVIRREAIAKDRILRGDGINFPPQHDAGYWRGTTAEEIQNLANSLKLALPGLESLPVVATIKSRGLVSKLNDLSDRNRWWIAAIGLLSALGGLIFLGP